MSTRTVFGVIGGIAGAFFGAPQFGWMIGSAIGNAVDPQIIRGPRIGDIPNQTGQEGGPIPIVFARSPPIAGNIIASGPPRTVKKRKSGKGGPKVETETVYRTYAIGVCEGEVRFLRVWRNGQIVYDVSDEENFHDFDDRDLAEYAFRRLTNNQAFIDKVTFYPGSYTQTADPDLEAIFGVGTTPAHRGTAYMVVTDDDLTDMRGAIPQYVFQVEKGLTGEAEIIYHVGIHEWEKPAGLESAEVIVIAGGGGGASGGGRLAFIPHSGSGGQGGGISIETFDAGDLPDTVVVTVGAGGIPGTATTGQQYGVAGADGEDSSFGALLEAFGGDGGTSQNTDGGAEQGQGTTEDGGEGGDADAGPTGGSGERGLPGASTNIAPAGGGGGGVPDTSALMGPAGGGGSTSAPTLGGTPGNPDTASGPGESAVAGAGEPGASPETPGTGGGGGGGGGGGVGIGDSSSQSHGGAGGGGGDGIVIVRQQFAALYASLAEVVTDVCARAGIPAELIDVTLLTDSVRGFMVTNQYPAKEALRSLSQVFLFDAAPVEGRIVFIPRGRNSVATITEDEMIDDETEIENTKRADAIQIPRVLNLNYFDIAGQLAPDKQTSERSGDRRAQGDSQLQTPVILSADEAARVVRIAHQVMIEDQKGELHFALPDKFIGLTPADVIFIQWEGMTQRIRLTKVDTFDGYQEYTALRDRQSSYVSNVEGYPASPVLFPASQAVGPTLIRPMDIPLQRDTDDGLGLVLYLAVSGVEEAWQGATVELSYDGGANYVDSGTVEVSSTIGELLEDLPDHPREFPDVTHTLRVRIDTPDSALEDSTLAGMLNRANRAVIQSEVLQFAAADEVEPGIWELTNLLRGRQGTASEPHVTGTKFILLDSYVTVPMSVTDIGRTLTFRATSYGAPSDTGTVISIVYQGVSQTEREVGYLTARRDGTDAIVEWQGVGRLGGGATVAHGARFTGYRVTFDDGFNPAVVVDTSAQTITQGIGALSSPVTISVQQINALTGAGPAVEVVLT